MAVEIWNLVWSIAGVSSLVVAVAVAFLLKALCGGTPPMTKYTYPPSPMAIPIIGHPFHLLLTTYSYVMQTSLKLGGGSHVLRLFRQHFLFLNTWHDLKDALVNQADIFTKSFVMANLNKSESTRKAFQTFLFCEGPVWKEKRRFTLHHLRNFGFGKSIMENTISEEFDRICAVIDRNPTMTFHSTFFCSFLNVLWGIIAGKTYEYDDQELLSMAESMNTTFKLGKNGFIMSAVPLVKYIPGDPFNTGALKRSLATVTSFIERQIDEHISVLSDGEPRDYIEAYLQEIKRHEGQPVTETTICYNRQHLLGAIYDILQAGAETTSTTMEWALLYMALWPEIQKRVQDELDTVIGRSRPTVYSDNPSLPYVRATIMEIQRYCTVIPLCSPRAVVRQTTLGNYTIGKDTLVFQNLYAVHHDKQLWGDPEVFRPERFLNAEETDGWVPFSIGPRICLGKSLARMELFLFFSRFMQKYSFKCVTGKPLPSIVPVIGLTLRPQPFQLVISPRQS